MLGCPMEHLEFTLWFLKESGLIRRSDSNQFEITCRGVAEFEQTDSNFSRKPYVSMSAPAQAAG